MGNSFSQTTNSYLYRFSYYLLWLKLQTGDVDLITERKIPIWTFGILFGVYRTGKWILHMFTGASAIERICISRRKEETGIQQASFSIFRQIGLSRQLLIYEVESEEEKAAHDIHWTSFSDAEECLEMTQSIEAVKLHKAPEQTEALLIYSMACIKGISRALKNIQNEARNKTTWIDGSQKFIEIFNSIFEDINDNTISVEDDEHDENIPLLSRSRYHGHGNLTKNRPNPNSRAKSGIDWVSLGFQGLDPSSDFRATGNFGLTCYNSFCVNHTRQARTVILESGSFEGSDDPTMPWYSAALVSIHLSLFIINLIKANYLYKWIYFHLTTYESLDLLNFKENHLELARETIQFTLKLTNDNIIDLHHQLFNKFHEHWLNEVRTGVLMTVLDTEESLSRFEQKAALELWNLTF